MRTEKNKNNVKVFYEKSAKSSENIFIYYIFPALEILLVVLQLKLYVNAIKSQKMSVSQVS